MWDERERASSSGRERRELGTRLQVRPQPLGCGSRVGRSSNNPGVPKIRFGDEAWGLVRPDIGGSVYSVDFAEVVEPLRLPPGLELQFLIQTVKCMPCYSQRHAASLSLLGILAETLERGARGR